VDFQSRFNQSRCKCKCRTQPSLAPLPRRPFSRVRVADTAFPAGFTFGSAKDGRTRGRVAATRRGIGASGTIRSRNLVRRGSHAAFPPRNIERSTYRAGIPRLIGRCDTERKSPVTFARSDKRRVRDIYYFISFRSLECASFASREITYVDTRFAPYITPSREFRDVEERIPLRRVRGKFTSRFNA